MPLNRPCRICHQPTIFVSTRSRICPPCCNDRFSERMSAVDRTAARREQEFTLLARELDDYFAARGIEVR